MCWLVLRFCSRGFKSGVQGCPREFYWCSIRSVNVLKYCPNCLVFFLRKRSTFLLTFTGLLTSKLFSKWVYLRYDPLQKPHSSSIQSRCLSPFMALDLVSSYFSSLILHSLLVLNADVDNLISFVIVSTLLLHWAGILGTGVEWGNAHWNTHGEQQREEARCISTNVPNRYLSGPTEVDFTVGKSWNVFSGDQPPEI